MKNGEVSVVKSAPLGMATFLYLIFIIMVGCKNVQLDPNAYLRDPVFQSAQQELAAKEAKLKSVTDHYQTTKKFYDESKKESGRASLEKEKSTYFQARDQLQLAWRDVLAARYRIKYERLQAQKRALLEMFHVEHRSSTAATLSQPTQP